MEASLDRTHSFKMNQLKARKEGEDGTKEREQRTQNSSERNKKRLNKSKNQGKATASGPGPHQHPTWGKKKGEGTLR